MKIVGCDLHARQQTIAIVDTETGEFTEKTLCHEGNAVRAFYAALEGPVVVGARLECLLSAGNERRAQGVPMFRDQDLLFFARLL